MSTLEHCERWWYEDEWPAHLVEMDGFWIDRNEVTNRQFTAFLNDYGEIPQGERRWADPESDHFAIQKVDGVYQPEPGYADHPVVEVSWLGAAAYCRWVDARLPTEAEWEYTARGPEGLRYPWGDEFESARLNYCDASCELGVADSTFSDGYGRTAPVGSFPGGDSWCGAQDMAGNVMEWVSDWHGEYPAERQVNPRGPLFGRKRVLRGGSWFDGLDYVRSANRYGWFPEETHTYWGFRCATSNRVKP